MFPYTTQTSDKYPDASGVQIFISVLYGLMLLEFRMFPPGTQAGDKYPAAWV